MEPSWIEAGAVYRWAHDERPMRVLMHDHDVAMYDVWWPHLRNWGLSNIGEAKRKRIDYYVTRISSLASKASYLRTDPLTEEEFKLHRPDLPFSMGRCSEVQWAESVPETRQEMAERLRSAGCLSDGGETTVPASDLYLVPFGPNGGQKRPVRVKPDDGVAFTIEELIWKSARAQAEVVDGVLPTEGIGVYRAGLQRGVPSYYLWGADSKLHSRAS
ncbi:hypothetical protein ACGFI9_19020 [Micromonospora sp. NPDC048930]|uniref:hypothetical protein n=1 Tax=Micromonospora sp. NPDC048930 TaxID=3364261 RepID=UPI003715EB16